MRNNQNNIIPKNKQLNPNSSNFDIEEVNKAIELTRFNVSILILKFFKNIENKCKKCF